MNNCRLIKLRNFIIRILSGFILFSEYRKTFRNKYMVDLNPNKINGIGNKIILFKNGQSNDYTYKKIKGLSISIDGDYNCIKLVMPSTIINSRIEIRGNQNEIKIQKCHSTGLLNAFFSLGSRANYRKILIGENFSCGGVTFANNISNNIIEVGKDCMFSENIRIRADDGHVIYQKDTQNIINNSNGVKIGNHVWLSENSYIGKDVEIADNCIVGFGAIVTKSCLEDSSIIAGVPAKVIKNNVRWERYNHNKITDEPQTHVVVGGVVPIRFFKELKVA